MIEKEIIKLIQNKITLSVANSTFPNLHIQALGRTIIPDNSQKYLEILHFANNIKNEFWGNSKTYRGLVRLILHWPIDDAGDYPALDLLQSICTQFDKDLVLQEGEVQVKFSEKPDFFGALTSGQDRIFPVTLEYYSFQPN